MATNPRLTFRWFYAFGDSGDYDVFTKWCAGHEVEALPIEYLPARGIVICQEDVPVAMLWVYYDDSTPVCFAERAITCPGLSMEVAARAICFAVEIAKDCAIRIGYDLMLARVPKAMARYAIGRLGFEIEEQEVINLCFRLVRKEDLCPGSLQ